MSGVRSVKMGNSGMSSPALSTVKAFRNWLKSDSQINPSQFQIAVRAFGKGRKVDLGKGLVIACNEAKPSFYNSEEDRFYEISGRRDLECLDENQSNMYYQKAQYWAEVGDLVTIKPEIRNGLKGFSIIGPSGRVVFSRFSLDWNLAG